MEKDKKLTEKLNWGGDMLDRTKIVPAIPLSELTDNLTRTQRERILSSYDMKKFARIFEDESMITTIDSFFINGMNVSETARKLYMHRNTLIYRLNKIYKVTGLDIRVFDMAVTFEILRKLYNNK